MSQNQETTKKQVISKWRKPPPIGNVRPLQEVVYKRPIGKNKKGKVIYKSFTKHEAID